MWCSPFQCDSCYSKKCECEWIEARGRAAGWHQESHSSSTCEAFLAGHTWQEGDSWLRLWQPPARPVGEDGVPQARNRASPHQRPVAPASLQSGLSPLSLSLSGETASAAPNNTTLIFFFRCKEGWASDFCQLRFLIGRSVDDDVCVQLSATRREFHAF